jgi:hypothetical protein
MFLRSLVPAKLYLEGGGGGGGNKKKVKKKKKLGLYFCLKINETHTNI